MFQRLIDFFNAIVAAIGATEGGESASIPDTRQVSGDAFGRNWWLIFIKFTKAVNQKNLNTITDRSTLNNLIPSRLAVQNVNGKQGVAHLEVELDYLYSVQKCFIAREKTRIGYYRDDLSQKGKRHLYVNHVALDNLNYIGNRLDGNV